MSEKKKSFQEFLANDTLNPGVKDDKLQKVDVEARDVAEDNDCKYDKKAIKAAVPKIKKKPVALFGILCLAFLGLTIGLSFVSLWALFGIIPTLLCFWKMVSNNADNNYKSVYSRFDGKYVDKELDRVEKFEELEPDLVKAEAKDKIPDLKEEEDEKKEVEKKKEKKELKSKKNSKTKDKEEEEVDDFDYDEEEEEEEEEKKNKRAEKSDKKFGSKVERSSKKDVENEMSKTSLAERNKRIKEQRAIDRVMN